MFKVYRHRCHELGGEAIATAVLILLRDSFADRVGYMGLRQRLTLGIVVEGRRSHAGQEGATHETGEQGDGHRPP